ncbi:Nif11 family protein [Lysinibacillus fusiformis]
MSIQFLQQLAQSTDKEIVAIAREEGFDITTSEVKKLRALFGAILIFLAFFRHS